MDTDTTAARWWRVPAATGRCLYRIIAVLLVAFVPASAAADSRFEAFDLKNGALLFQGRMTVSTADADVTEFTEYTRTDGTVVQQAEVSFDPETLRLSAFRSFDLRTGETETMIARDGRVTLTYREHARAGERTESLAWTPNTAFSTSITRRIHRAWEDLRSGSTLSMELLVPSRLESVGFRVVWEGDAELNGQSVVVMRMEPSTWLIRQLVDPLRFYFAAEAPHRLIEYRGRTAVKTEDGRPQDARVVYYALAEGS